MYMLMWYEDLKEALPRRLCTTIPILYIKLLKKVGILTTRTVKLIHISRPDKQILIDTSFFISLHLPLRVRDVHYGGRGVSE